MNYLTKCQDYATSNGGICLSKDYINSKSKLLWKCSKEHKWLATWQNEKVRKTWCPECNIRSNKKANIIELQEFAISKNGLLISTEYINAKTNLIWQCSENHQFMAKWQNIKSHSWCPFCYMLSITTDISELQQYAINKNGKLLSTNYINCMSNVLWECELGHQWETKWAYVKHDNTWCPECSRFKTEKICKELLQEKFKIILKKRRFIYHNTRLEFDGYNKENKIAFEYNGYQHYIFPNYFQKTLKEFEDLKYRDSLKEQYCAENNIRLIIIPYTEEEYLQQYINELDY